MNWKADLHGMRAGSRARRRGRRARTRATPMGWSGLDRLEARLLLSAQPIGPSLEAAAGAAEHAAEPRLDPRWPLNRSDAWRGPAPAAADADPEEAVADLLADLAESVPGFHVVDLPRSGAVGLEMVDSLTVDDLRGVALDPDPPAIGEPETPLPANLTDGYEPGTGPYVADDIAPFDFDAFTNEFRFWGNHNGEITAYARAHGYDVIESFGIPPDAWSHLPEDTLWGGKIQFTWDAWMREHELDVRRYNQLPPRDDLIRMLIDEGRVWGPGAKHVLMLDLEHPPPLDSAEALPANQFRSSLQGQSWYPADAGEAERLAFEKAYYDGYVNTYLAMVEAARQMGWATVGIYTGNSTLQAIAPTWWGLATATTDTDLMRWRWDAYNRELIEGVDVLLPSVYAPYWSRSHVAYALANTDLNVQELHERGVDTPILPYFWIQAKAGGGGWRWWNRLTLPDEDLRAMTALSFFTGIDGTVNWAWSATSNFSRTWWEIKPLATVQAGQTLDLRSEAPERWPDATAQRYDALYVSDVDDNNNVRMQAIKTDLASRNYGILPNIDLITQWRFDGDVEEALRSTPVQPAGGSFEAGRFEDALRFDGDDAIDVSVPPAVTVEAEAMTLDGFVVHPLPLAGGGAVVSREGATGTAPGSAQTVFHGATGRYHVYVTYLHEKDGDARFRVERNGNSLGAWTAWTGPSGTRPGGYTIKRRTLKRDLFIQEGDLFTLKGFEDEEAYAAIDRIDFVPTLRFTYQEPFTLSAWVNLPATRAAEPQVLLGNSFKEEPGWNLRLTETNRIMFRLIEDEETFVGVMTRDALPTDSWVNVTAVWGGSSGTAAIYVDGRKDTSLLSDSQTAPFDFGRDGGFTIGALPDGSYGLDAAVDQLRIYKRALTAAEATALAEEGQHAFYVTTKADLAPCLRPKTEGVAAQVEGLALVRPFEFILANGLVHIDVDARAQYDAEPDESGLTALPIVRRVSLGDYHLIATYDPNALTSDAPSATIVLADFNGEPGLDLSLPADDRTRLFVVRTWQGPRADAGPDATAIAGASVVLSGSAGPDPAPGLTYAWTQVAGPDVQLDGADTPNASFTAPPVAEPTNLSFRLAITRTTEPLLSDADQVDILVLPEPPVAGFSASVTCGDFPLTVAFANQSDGLIDGYAWDFGDGSSSDQPDPTHTYRRLGHFTVSLTVSGPGGTSTFTMPQAIEVNGVNELFLDPGGDIAAAIASLPEGGVLWLGPGRYTAPDGIALKPGLTVTGAGRDRTVVEGGFSAAPGTVLGDLTIRTSSSAAIGLEATDADVEVRGALFTGSGTGIRLSRSQARVHHTIFDGSGGLTTGVAVIDGAQAGPDSLYNNVFHHVAGPAVSVAAAAALPLINNSIFAGNQRALELLDDATVPGDRVSFNAFDDNDALVTRPGPGPAPTIESLGTGNLHAPPGFVGDTGDAFDYHLRAMLVDVASDAGAAPAPNPCVDGGMPPTLIVPTGADDDPYQGGEHVLISGSQTFEIGEMVTLRAYRLDDVSEPLDETKRVSQVLAAPNAFSATSRAILFEQTIAGPYRADDYLVSSRTEYAPEPGPDTRRIDLGVYGGTDEATPGRPQRWSPADATLDGAVSVHDLARLIANWNRTDVSSPIDGDFNRDGRVGAVDLSMLITEWRIGSRPLANEALLFDDADRLVLRLFPDGRRELYLRADGPWTLDELEQGAVLRPGDRVIEIV